MVCTIFCAEILTLLKCEQQMSRDRGVMSSQDALLAEPGRLTIDERVRSRGASCSTPLLSL